jgi:hypothetical protein
MAVDHRKVVGDESLVDRDAIGRPDRPALLAAEAESAVAQACDRQEVVESRRAVRAVHVADHDP